jgi:hypothetical protein
LRFDLGKWIEIMDENWMLDEWAQMDNRFKNVQLVVENNFIRGKYKGTMKELKVVLQFM